MILHIATPTTVDAKQQPMLWTEVLESYIPSRACWREGFLE